jgi:hypothetical protein
MSDALSLVFSEYLGSLFQLVEEVEDEFVI